MTRPADLPPDARRHAPAEPLGRPATLRAAVRATLVAMALMLVFGSEALRAYVSYLPLWMAPVDLWLMDATTAWNDWMTAIGADRPQQWIGAAVDELRMMGAPG